QGGRSGTRDDREEAGRQRAAAEVGDEDTIAADARERVPVEETDIDRRGAQPSRARARVEDREVTLVENAEARRLHVVSPEGTQVGRADAESRRRRGVAVDVNGGERSWSVCPGESATRQIGRGVTHEERGPAVGASGE